MKKVLLSIFIVFSFSINLFAVADDSVMKSDATQKKYERKAVMGLADIGFSQDHINIPLQLCSENRCIPWTFTVNYPLSYNEKLKAAQTFYDWTISNRFDKIIMKDGSASMVTKHGEMNVETGDYIPYFKSGTSSLGDFQNRLESYLNGSVKPSLGKLLDATVEQRYKELPETEQETFMVTKAKELGVSAEFIRTLVNSSYVFAAHVERINGMGRVTKITKNVMGVPVVSFDVEFAVPVSVTFLIYHYDFEKKSFSLYKKLRASSGLTTSSKTFLLIPTHQQVMSFFLDTFQTSIKAASINANYQLKKDDNFALFMPVQAVKGSKIETDFGVMEDIRIDHPFTIMESVDGKMEKKGYVKARKVSKNCSDDYNPPTVMQVTNGAAEEADLLREYPWTGLFFNLGIGSNSTQFSYSSGGTGGSMFSAIGFHLGASINLGYSTNTSWLSEFYMDLFYQMSFDLGDSKNLGSPIWLGGGLGFSKRFYVGAGGFYIAPALNLAYEYGTDAEVQQFIVNPQAHFGFSLNPSVDIVLKAGWNLGFVVKSQFDNVDTFAHGLTATLDFNFHLPVVGAMAKLYSKPSNVCAVKKKEEKKAE
ncbi:MAG: hypothetical protein ACOX2F_00645 [bacterium]